MTCRLRRRKKVLTDAADPEPLRARPRVGSPPGAALPLGVAGPVLVAVALAGVVGEPGEK